MPERWRIPYVEHCQVDVVGLLKSRLDIFEGCFGFTLTVRPVGRLSDVFKTISFSKCLILIRDKLGTTVRETAQWYAIAGEMGFGKIDDGGGLIVC